MRTIRVITVVVALVCALGLALPTGVHAAGLWTPPLFVNPGFDDAVSCQMVNVGNGDLTATIEIWNGDTGAIDDQSTQTFSKKEVFDINISPTEPHYYFCHFTASSIGSARVSITRINNSNGSSDLNGYGQVK